MIYQAFQRGMAAIQDASGALAGLYDDSLFLSNYHEFLELKPRVTAPEAPVPVPRPFREALALDDVSFAYPRSERRVLDGVSLALRPGEVIALVGENGAGKTTLVKLICRLYDPTAGAVTLDGIDLRRFRPEALRREIGVIFQDFARYALTARENIRLGDHELASDDPRLAAAVRQAGAESVIRHLPDGLDTLLGCQFAGGTELSAGQWRRSRWPARSCAIRASWCWTNPRVRWTPSPSTSCSPRSAGCWRGGRPSSSATGSPRCAWRTPSTFWPAGASRKAAPMNPSWPPAATMPTCLSCSRRITGETDIGHRISDF